MVNAIFVNHENGKVNGIYIALAKYLFCGYTISNVYENLEAFFLLGCINYFR